MSPEPLVARRLSAMKKAVEALGVRETFHGYGNERAYDVEIALSRPVIADRHMSRRSTKILSRRIQMRFAVTFSTFSGTPHKVAVPDPFIRSHVATN